MADPPPVRRPPPTQPPIPGIPRLPALPLPIAPAAAMTELTPSTDDHTGEHTGESSVDGFDENTRSLIVPDPGQLVERVLELVASEAAALLVGDDPERPPRGSQRPHRAGLRRRPAPARRGDASPRARRAPPARATTPRDRARSAIPPHSQRPRPGSVTPPPTSRARRSRLPRRRSRSRSPKRGCSGTASPRSRRRSSSACSPASYPPRGVGTRSSWPRSRMVPQRRGRASPSCRRASLEPSCPPDVIAATAALVLDRAHDAPAALALCWAAIERVATDARRRLAARTRRRVRCRVARG